MDWLKNQMKDTGISAPELNQGIKRTENDDVQTNAPLIPFPFLRKKDMKQDFLSASFEG
jgi:hypothetical protein